MHLKTFSIIALVSASTTTAMPAQKSSSNSISVTPHASYSSSVGVLGCKVDTNRVAYWPSAVSCNDLCVKVSHAGRSVHLLKVDQSGGAHDISYDAWNYLSTGKSASQKPTEGGGIAATYENVPMSECASLLKNSNKKLAFSAANSMNFVSSCIADKNSWVAKNYALYNIANPACTLGKNELCKYKPAVSNQPQCPSQLGVQDPLKSTPVYNLAYGSGKKELATQ